MESLKNDRSYSSGSGERTFLKSNFVLDNILPPFNISFRYSCRVLASQFGVLSSRFTPARKLGRASDFILYVLINVIFSFNFLFSFLFLSKIDSLCCHRLGGFLLLSSNLLSIHTAENKCGLWSNEPGYKVFSATVSLSCSTE